MELGGGDKGVAGFVFMHSNLRCSTGEVDAQGILPKRLGTAVLEGGRPQAWKKLGSKKSGQDALCIPAPQHCGALWRRAGAPRALARQD